MNLNVLGIVGNVLHIAPFYAGDNSHEITLCDYEKNAFLEHGAIEYPDNGHIEAQLHGMTHEQWLEYVEAHTADAQERLQAEEREFFNTPDDLPF